MIVKNEGKKPIKEHILKNLSYRPKKFPKNLILVKNGQKALISSGGGGSQKTVSVLCSYDIILLPNGTNTSMLAYLSVLDGSLLFGSLALNGNERRVPLISETVILMNFDVLNDMSRYSLYSYSNMWFVPITIRLP